MNMGCSCMHPCITPLLERKSHNTHHPCMLHPCPCMFPSATKTPRECNPCACLLSCCHRSQLVNWYPQAVVFGSQATAHRLRHQHHSWILVVLRWRGQACASSSSKPCTTMIKPPKPFDACQGRPQWCPWMRGDGLALSARALSLLG